MMANWLVCHNVDFISPELNGAVDFCKNSIITPHTNIEAGMKLCSALTHDNCSCLGELAAIELYAAILRIAVSSVSG